MLPDIWVIGAESYESERILEEFTARNIGVMRFNWDELVLPFKHIPKGCLIRYSKGMMEKLSIVFVLSVMEELERRGCKVIPSLEGIYREDKMSMYLLWQKYLSDDILMPKTLITKNLDAAKTFLTKEKKVVFKPIIGGLGKDVIKIHNEKQLKMIYKKFNVLFLQKYIESPGYDIRAIVINGKVMASYARYNPDHFKHNIHSGGRGKTISEMKKIDPQVNDYISRIKNLSKKIAKTASLDLFGLDLLPSKDGRLYLLEWNSTFGFSGAESTTGLDIAKEIVEYAISKIA
ncbi:MAG: ATP-grasp domain-containing protein [Candidatus Lokiarchaeota archaeon]|nr:ATP-grasp domain-containing protein [Candidatus Lokiarchaeota archaeon]